jgi:hypothetical protein
MQYFSNTAHTTATYANKVYTANSAHFGNLEISSIDH